MEGRRQCSVSIGLDVGGARGLIGHAYLPTSFRVRRRLT